ncbi:uncharacterized protein LOC122659581 [Telopea speciosissima]|uniref:uncharacterized protein LOC122659581 n=1 Tax=Telopea speciosissima TaxID=54955 RepID=UPI001CC37C15|nr:uncharacterized protein LOC122659581 [Telopea speciosissima]
MEGISAGLYKGLRDSWRRRDYQRLDGSTRFRRRKNRVELSSSSEDATGPDNQRRRRRFWRIKVTPKLRFFTGMSSPKKFFRRLRDAYVKMMLGFANSRIFISGYGGGGGGGSFGMGKPTLKEYDQKVIIEIYKSLMAQGQLLPRDAARLAAATARS